MLAVLLALREDEPTTRASACRHPSWGAHLDLLAGGAQTRWEAVWSFLPAPVRDRIAVLSTVLGAAVCTVTVVFGEVAWPWRYPSTELAPGYLYSPPPIQTAGIAVYGTWLLALLVVVLFGRVHLARWLLAATALGAVVLAVARVIPHPPLYTLAPMALAYLVLTGALASIQGWRSPIDGVDPVWLFYRGAGMHLLSASVVLLAAVAVLVTTGASITGRTWFLATAFTALPYVYLWAFSVSGTNQEQMLVVAAIVSAVPALLILGALLGLRVSIENRRRTTAGGGPG